MEKEEKIETIEGGDSSSDSEGLEYTEPKAEEKDASTDDDKDFRDRPAEEHRIEGGDDKWDKDQEGANLDDSGEKEVKKEKKEVEEEKKAEGEELTTEEKADKKAQEDVIKYLEEDGGDAKYIIKGKEYDLRDLTPQEFKNRFALAGRAQERMQEIAAKEKTINERERVAEDGARKSQEIMRRYGGDESEKGKEDLPDILKPDTDDTDLEASLKQMNAKLYQKVDNLERGVQEQDFSAKEQQLYRDLDFLQKEFPMMSKSEVVAVKSMPEYANADIRVVAENSHNERAGDAYLDAVFKTRPDKLREIEEKAVEKYLEKKPNVSKVSRRKSSTVASGKISSGKKITPRTLDEIEAHIDKKGGWSEILSEADED